MCYSGGYLCAGNDAGRRLCAFPPLGARRPRGRLSKNEGKEEASDDSSLSQSNKERDGQGCLEQDECANVVRRIWLSRGQELLIAGCTSSVQKGLRKEARALLVSCCLSLHGRKSFVSSDKHAETVPIELSFIGARAENDSARCGWKVVVRCAFLHLEQDRRATQHVILGYAFKRERPATATVQAFATA